jgi:type I restriction enzyme, R subunit
MAFVDLVSVTGDTSEDWRLSVPAEGDAELDSLITEKNLKAEETRQFIEYAFPRRRHPDRKM